MVQEEQEDLNRLLVQRVMGTEKLDNHQDFLQLKEPVQCVAA